MSTEDIKRYIDILLDKGLTAQTINSHLIAIRRYYGYLTDEENSNIDNPVSRGMSLRLPRPLPQHLQDRDVTRFLETITKPRDTAIFMIMLRCGLRVEEVAGLTLRDIDYSKSQIMARSGTGNKDRVVYISNDAASALAQYLRNRPVSKQLLNADAALVTIQDLLGHTRIKTTQRYCRLSNNKAQRDYYKAMDSIMRKAESEYLADDGW